MITTKEKLIKFMELKAELIVNRIKNTKNGTISTKKYFNNTDKKDILEWPESKAKEVWDCLVSNIAGGSHGLYSSTCPFCIYITTICTECAYGRSHGICATSKSDYHLIRHYYDVQLYVPDYIEMIKLTEQVE